MATRSLRNRGPSRFSSPAVLAGSEVPEQVEEEDGGKHGQAMGGGAVWVEPPVRKLPPSYQDHKGLERVGVLEMQQPLGEPPSQKLLQRLKLTYKGSSNRGTPLHTEELATPTTENERMDFGSPMETDRVSENDHGNEDFLDEAAQTESPPRGRPAKRDAAEMRSSANRDNGDATTSPVDAATYSTTSSVPNRPLSIQEHLRQDRVTTVVDRAIHEAQLKGDLGLIPGLNRIRKDAGRRRDLWTVLEAVSHQTPTPEQLHIFKRFIKKGLKQYQKYGLPDDLAFQSPSHRPSTDTQHTTSPSAIDADQPQLLLSPLPARRTSSKLPSKSPRRMRMEGGTDGSPAQARSSKGTRHKRTRSHSSSSSLSSAKSLPDEDAPVLAEGESEAAESEVRPLRNGAPRQAGERIPANNRLRSSATNQPEPKHPFSNFNDVSKLASSKLIKKNRASRESVDYDIAEIEKARKRYLANSFQNYNYIPRDESNIRTQLPEDQEVDDPNQASSSEVQVPPPVIHERAVRSTSDTVASGVTSQALADHNLLNGNSRKRNFDEFDTDSVDIPTPLSSSPAPPFNLLAPAGALRSRAGTPRTSKVQATGRPRKSARVMISPNKPKNGGITAGIQRSAPPKDAVVANGADSGAEDNDEFCSSCGGEGTLLCCDGCVRSFHFSCLEPPMNSDEEVVGEWFCSNCIAKRNKNRPQATGIMGQAIRAVDDMIPKAFTLPYSIRNYFEGVRTGEEGEYEEFGPPPTHNVLKMNRAGFFEEPNYKEPRDTKGKILLCHHCGEGANGRDLIACSFCDARWHLDCLDPPLAVPPRRRPGDKPNASWRCPLHVEGDLANLGRNAEYAPGELGGRPRPRKPKNARVVDAPLVRGMPNNGIIEILNDEESGPDIKEIDMNGTVLRLPERGIKLDFIDRVKRSWYEDEMNPWLMGRSRGMQNRIYRPSDAPIYHPPQEMIVEYKEPSFAKGAQAISIAETARANAALRRKTFPEQEAVLSLSAMSGLPKDMTPDLMSDLVNRLVAEAPPEVAEASKKTERQQLQRLQGLITRRLRLLEPNMDVVNAMKPATAPFSGPTRFQSIKPAPPIQPRQPPVLAPAPSNQRQQAMGDAMHTSSWQGQGPSRSTSNGTGAAPAMSAGKHHSQAFSNQSGQFPTQQQVGPTSQNYHMPSGHAQTGPYQNMPLNPYSSKPLWSSGPRVSGHAPPTGLQPTRPSDAPGQQQQSQQGHVMSGGLGFVPPTSSVRDEPTQRSRSLNQESNQNRDLNDNDSSDDDPALDPRLFGPLTDEERKRRELSDEQYIAANFFAPDDRPPLPPDADYSYGSSPSPASSHARFDANDALPSASNAEAMEAAFAAQEDARRGSENDYDDDDDDGDEDGNEPGHEPVLRRRDPESPSQLSSSSPVLATIEQDTKVKEGIPSYVPSAAAHHINNLASQSDGANDADIDMAEAGAEAEPTNAADANTTPAVSGVANTTSAPVDESVALNGPSISGVSRRQEKEGEDVEMD